MNRENIRRLAIAALVIVVMLVVGTIARQHAYFLARVDPQEVGVRFRGGRIVEVVGPGVYSDVALYADLKRVSSEAVSFSVEDPEVITSDRQRVGLRVSGDAFRPGVGSADRLQELWPAYQGLYLSDDALRTRVNDLALQAMKVCVGERTFNENVIGEARDEVRICIDEEISQLADGIGLDIQNVTVPNVVLSPEVQASLDAITKSRLDTELAQQDAIKAREQAAADQAREEGAIRVQLARQQEEVRQKTVLSELERAQLVAQLSVIEQEKTNDLFSAQQDLEINAVRAEAALTAARAALAQETVLAELYATNPDYVYLQALLANASALSESDKIIFTPEGTSPTIVVPGPGILPTVETAAVGEAGGEVAPVVVPETTAP
ncbi:MAG: SPFH domain-containing protein [Anaerolineae bacterium]|nr:SPFH domain-containing protein [Anaerolineae bacterium]